MANFAYKFDNYNQIILYLGLPHPALSPSFLSPSGGSIRHQDYLNAAAQRLSEMQASAALDPINAMEGKS